VYIAFTNTYRNGTTSGFGKFNPLSKMLLKEIERNDERNDEINGMSEPNRESTP
jgi:hypothetical protein